MTPASLQSLRAVFGCLLGLVALGGAWAQPSGKKQDAQRILIALTHASPSADRELLEPLVVYEGGKWKSDKGRKEVGPEQWVSVGFGEEGGDLQTKVVQAGRKPARFEGVCEGVGWGFPVTSGDVQGRVAISEGVALQGMTQTLLSGGHFILRAVERPGSFELSDARRRLQKSMGACGAAEAWKPGVPDGGFEGGLTPAKMYCTEKTPGVEQVCYVVREIGFVTTVASESGEKPCSAVCVSQDWVVLGGKAPRLVYSVRDCREEAEVDRGWKPFASMVVDGRLHVLALPQCFEGCSGIGVFEAGAKEAKRVAVGASDVSCD